MYDAIVVGARVSGAPTAMLLARKGHQVLLVDRASFPSDTMSTLIIWQTGVAKLKQWGLLDRLTATGLPANTKFTMDLGDFPLGGWAPPVDGVTDSYAPRRKVIDKILVDAAVEAGVEFREKFSVRELIFDGDQVVGVHHVVDCRQGAVLEGVFEQLLVGGRTPPWLDANVAQYLVKPRDFRQLANLGASLNLPAHNGGCHVDLSSQSGRCGLDRYLAVQDRPGAESKLLAGG